MRLLKAPKKRTMKFWHQTGILLNEAKNNSARPIHRHSAQTMALWVKGSLTCTHYESQEENAWTWQSSIEWHSMRQLLCFIDPKNRFWPIEFQMKQSKPLFNEFDETICILIDFLSTEFHSELDTSKTFTGYKKITFEKKNYSMGNLIVFISQKHLKDSLKLPQFLWIYRKHSISYRYEILVNLCISFFPF